MVPRNPRSVLGLAALLALAGCPTDGDDDDSSIGDDDDEASPWDEEFAWELSQPVECPAPVPEDDALEDLLVELELDLSVGIDFSWYERYGGYIESDPTRLDFFHELQEDITLIPCTAGGFALRADEGAESEHRLATQLADAAGELGFAVTAGGALPEPDGDDPLLDALNEIEEYAGEEGFGSQLDDPLAAVPEEVQRLAGTLILALLEAIEVRDDALDAIVGPWDEAVLFERLPHTYITSVDPGLDSNDPDDLAILAPEEAGFGELLSGGVRLGQVLDELDLPVLAGSLPAGDFDLYVDTSLGGVLVRGDGDHVYELDGEDHHLPEGLLLVLDTGGDDTYRIPAGATTSSSNPASLLVDLGGNDRYGYEEVGSPHDEDGLLPSDDHGRYPGDLSYGPFTNSNHPRQGAGILGYGYLVDVGGGDDVYRTLRFGQGFGALGVGLLWDDGGTDDYECESACQAAAASGLGLLHEGGGDDSYRAFYSAQAFASPAAFAMLYDADGADTYHLEPDEPFVYAWYDGWTHNISRGQGASTGWRRANYMEDVYLSGGIGMLRDRAGDDSYTASVMAQANGYWFGFGILADAAGDDRYNGYNYVQGATEHFALAAFLEGGGDDTYNDAMEPTHSDLGLAHDYSVTVFVEGGGDDWYYGPDRGIGVSKCHGLGILVDRSGDDEFHTWSDKAIGWATDYDWAAGTCGESTWIPSYGFFADLDGSDLYDKPDPTGYGDDQTWITDDPDDLDAMELSGGVDTTGGECFARAYGEAWRGR